MKPSFLVCAFSLIWLAACGAPTPPLSPTPIPAATTENVATATLVATAAERATSTSAATATALATSTPAATATATTALNISSGAAAYLEAALAIMQKNGLHRLELDWATVRAHAFQMAEHAQTPAETYDTIRDVLAEAGGQHSTFLTPIQAADSAHLTVADNPAPRGKLLLGKLGLIAVEKFTSGNPDEAAKYATLVQQVIQGVDAQGPCGWLVDLRQNEEGDMWPMLAGIGPLLGEGKVGAFVDPEGLRTEWSYHNGQALLGADVMVQVNGPAYDLLAASPPVAVLTGFRTTDSGEAIAISFRGRPQTRSFGIDTAGLSTGNARFPLSDGAVIILTIGVMADRTGQTFGGHVSPDEKVDDLRKLTRIMDEVIPQPAIDWLLVQPACAAHK